MEAEDIYNLSGNLREISNYIVSAETEFPGTACLQTDIKQLGQMVSLKGWPNAKLCSPNSCLRTLRHYGEAS